MGFNHSEIVNKVMNEIPTTNNVVFTNNNPLHTYTQVDTKILIEHEQFLKSLWKILYINDLADTISFTGIGVEYMVKKFKKVEDEAKIKYITENDSEEEDE